MPPQIKDKEQNTEQRILDAIVMLPEKMNGVYRDIILQATQATKKEHSNLFSAQNKELANIVSKINVIDSKVEKHASDIVSAEKDLIMLQESTKHLSQALTAHVELIKEENNKRDKKISDNTKWIWIASGVVLAGMTIGGVVFNSTITEAVRSVLKSELPGVINLLEKNYQKI